MVAKVDKSPGSAKVEVGEIDNRAPFQSVKDAVTLFGEGAFSGERATIKKAKPHSAERVLAKETQLYLTQKELDKLREQLKNAESTKLQALVELEKAKRTVEGLSQKLNTVNECKEIAILKQTEIAKSLVKQLEETSYSDPDGKQGAQKGDLDSAKQELRKIRQYHEEAMAIKDAAVKYVEEADLAADANMERVRELSNEISTVQEAIGQVNETLTTEEEQVQIFAEKDVQRQAWKTMLELSGKKLLTLKDDFDPEVNRNLEVQLSEAAEDQIGYLKELDDAKGSLKKVAEEESSLGSWVEESLKGELENVKKEHAELTETESIVENLHKNLQKSKVDLESYLPEESEVSGTSDEMVATLHHLVSETEIARKEAGEMQNRAGGELKKEAEAIRTVLRGTALEEAEEAKVAEATALKRMAVMQKEIEDMRAEKEASLKRAEVAEAARRAVEGELRRWQERELKKAAADTTSRIFAETESKQQIYRIQKQQQLPDKVVEVRRLEKEKISVPKKTLWRSLSGIFNRKKNQVEGGSTSYLPGEKQKPI